jgi:transcriptional antiterminator NusG
MVVEQVELESEASEMESAGTEAAEAIAAEAQASEEAAAAVEPTDVPDETETTEQAVEAARPKGPEPEPVELEIVEAEAEPEALELEVEEAVEAEEAEAEPGAVELEVEEAVEAEEAEAEPETLAVEVPQDGRAWYVIHCYSGYEAKVRHNLEQRIETMQMQDQIFQVVVPTEDEIEVRDGKRRVVERRVFPGYILVQMLLSDDSWYVVRNTPGVTGFVGMGNDPTPLRTEEVQSIMKRMEAEAPKIKVTFKHGQKVRIIDGPFNEFIGVVDEIDMERAKVRVLVSFFGRETPVELDFLQVEKT